MCTRKKGRVSSTHTCILDEGKTALWVCKDLLHALAGEAVVSVPEHLLITAARAKQSDFGRALQQVPGLHDEALLLLWILVEVHDEESLWAPFWRSLPDTFNTGAPAVGCPARQIM